MIYATTVAYCHYYCDMLPLLLWLTTTFAMACSLDLS